MTMGNIQGLVNRVLSDVNEFSKLVDGAMAVVSYRGKCIKKVYFSGNLIISRDERTLYIIGDLHGDYDTLLSILSRENILKCLQDDTCCIVFLGDYIDRGVKQLETIAGVLALKQMFPGNVVLLRGNHEPPPMLIPYPHDFPEILRLRYGERGSIIYRNGLFRLFQKLPLLAVIDEDILLLHGGPPSTVLDAKSFEEAFSLNLPQPDDEVVEDILWSDPEEGIRIIPSFRGAGKLYGPDVSMKALKLSNTKIIVRGHEPVEGGYKINHNGCVITLFTSKAPIYGIYVVSYMVVKGKFDPRETTKYIKTI